MSILSLRPAHPFPTVPANAPAKDDRIQHALDSFVTNKARMVDLAIAIQQIPAPTFDEGQRASYVHDYFGRIGLTDVTTDPLHNVYGRFAGRNPDLPPVVISAHSDTVFPHGTDLTVRRDGDLVYGPGIADNSAGVAGLMTLAATLRRYRLQPERDIWCVVNSGEEGLGDLLGMRAVVNRFEAAHAYIVIEGGMYGYLLHEGIGVRRFQVKVETAGGHSWSDFGRTNSIHVLSHIISKIDGIRVPKSPKTTYNVGRIEGGTSINTIAQSANFQLDLRSEEVNGLSYLVQQFEQVVQQARRKFDDATISIEKIGDRPAGTLNRRSWLVKMADAALRQSGCQKIHYLRGSTDANIPLSRGYPAICIGLAQSANAHRLDEYFDPTKLPQGMQQLLLLTLSAASVNN